jgi:DNA polymerase
MLVPVYDIRNCGPRHRFVANGKLVHNSDSINLQNLPSRGPNAKQIKKAIVAPEGYTLIEADSSQIEARVLAWLAGQDDIVSAFANKQDVYKKMASAIYSKDEGEIDKQERHVGKTTVLGCGYGMGAPKFQDALKNGFPPVELPLDEARRIINVYRDTNWKIVQLWRNAQNALVAMSRGDTSPIDVHGLLEVVPDAPGIRLPSGLIVRYDDLRFDETEKGVQFHYNTRQGRTRIYGGKVVENVTQGVARCIIGEQMLRIAKTYRVVLTVHDSIVCLVRDEEVPEAQAFIEAEMRRPPEWAPGLPVDCESGVGKSYGDCE